MVTEDAYMNALANHNEWFDNSDYPQNISDPLSSLYNNSNKKRVGHFKDENSKDPIVSIVCLKAKLYATIMRSEAVIAKAKGIKKLP